MNYEEFIRTKKRAEVATGHNPGDLNEYMFDFQHAIVAWAVRMGRRFVGSELKPQYWELACQNIADASKEQQGLFGLAV